MPFEIPASWKWVRIKDIAISELGKTLDKGKNSGEFYDYLCALNVKWGAFDLATVKQILLEDKEKERYLVRKGDLLIGEGGDVGRAAIWENEKEIYYQNALHRVRFKGGIDQYFYLYALQYYKHLGFIDDVSGGVTIKHFTQNSMQKLLFPLPPLQEQKRIAYSIVQWFALIDEIEANKKDLQEYIKQTKSKVLDLAIHGKLVPQDPNDEPATELLKRINPHFTSCDTSHYENLPSGWVVCHLSEVIDLLDNKRQPIKAEVRAERIKGKKILFPYYGATGFAGYIDDYLIEGKFILLGEDGAPFLDKYAEKAYAVEGKIWVNNHAHVLQPKIDFDYLRIYLNAFDYYGIAKGTTRLKLTQGDMNQIPVWVPPLQEQMRISSKVQAVFTAIDTITAEL